MRHFKRIGGVFFNFTIFAVLLFVPAWTIHWPRAWLLLAIVFVAGIFSVYAISDDLLDERYKPPLQKGQPLIDKVILLAFLLSFTATIILVPVDVFRVHLLPPPGRIVAFSGLLLFIAGWWILTCALVENSYAAPVVKLQKDRGQHV